MNFYLNMVRLSLLLSTAIYALITGEFLLKLTNLNPRHLHNLYLCKTLAYLFGGVSVIYYFILPVFVFLPAVCALIAVVQCHRAEREW